MNYSQLRKFDISNGPFVRYTMFVSGCHFNCRNCFNKEYQDFKHGKLYTKETEDEILSYMRSDNIKGFSLLGGEPFEQLKNGYELDRLVERIKKETNKDTWVWTGYTWEEIIKNDRFLEFVQKIDTLVDGPFIESKKNIKLKFRGSSNQRIINVQESLKVGKIIERIELY